jgi:D-serine deaminase-like pyridoxal phosphate-dependent protein
VDLHEHLAALRERPIDVTEKGFGLLAGPVSAASIAAARPALHAAGLSYPLLALRHGALAHNAQAMAAYCAARGVQLAPHGKTGMSPELAALQLEHGAWAITVATIGQLRAYRSFGFPRLLLANELTDRAGIAWLAAERAADPGFAAYCYVDNPQTLSWYETAVPSPPLPVLVEIGDEHTRTGCRTDTEALAVAKAAAATGTLRVAGVAGYEGTIRGDDSLERKAAFCRRLRRLADELRGFGDGTEEFIVTAGGSTHFDIVADELTAGDTSGLRIVLRSGAYLYHDHGHYARTSPAARAPSSGTAAAGPAASGPAAPRFQPAIELWAQVLSRPEPELALLGFGRRDAGFDAGLPVPLRTLPDPADVTGWQVTGLNDQHAYLSVPADATLSPGDLVCLGISHPCTTLDKWRVIPVVDDAARINDVIHTFF